MSDQSEHAEGRSRRRAASDHTKPASQRTLDSAKERGEQAWSDFRAEMHRPIPIALALLALGGFVLAGYVAWTGGSERDSLQGQLEERDRVTGSLTENQGRLKSLQASVAQLAERAKRAEAELSPLNDERL